jgi:hypothetical protein
MYCPKCGTLSNTDSYCRSCGANLGRVATALADKELNRHYSARRAGGTTLGIFHSEVITNEARDLSGHSAAAVFGQVILDLSAQPLPAGEMRINLYAIFGGAEVIVPSDVGVRVTGVSMLSGIKVRDHALGNGFFSVNEYVTPGYERAVRRIHIDATSVFGGITIKR